MAGGAIGVIAGALSLAQGLFGQSQREAQMAAERKRLTAEQQAAQEKLNAAIRDSISLTGDFARSLSSDPALLQNEFRDQVYVLEQTLGPLGLIPETILGRSWDIRRQIEDWNKRTGGDYEYLNLALNRAVTVARTIEEQKTDIELTLRREQGKIIIDEIERQRRDVLAALENSMEAQRQAAIRATRLQFDFAEAQLRAQYIPQFQAAGGNQDLQAFLLGRVGQEIESLQAQESATLEFRLNDELSRYNDAVDRTNALYDGIVGRD